MGRWGTGIGANDTFGTFYDQFFGMYREGLAIGEITRRMIQNNQFRIDDVDQANEFWFALAFAQWECKELDPVIYAVVENIIETGSDIEVWKRMKVSPADLQAREKVLAEFLARLKKEMASSKKQMEKKLYSSMFQAGDCLVYKMNNNNFGGTYVLAGESDTAEGMNIMALTTINQPGKPSLTDFQETEVYVQRAIERSNSEHLIDQPQIGLFSAMLFKKGEVDIEVIGQLPVNRDYRLSCRVRLNFWSRLKSALPGNDEYIKTNGRPAMILKLNELIDGAR